MYTIEGCTLHVCYSFSIDTPVIAENMTLSCKIDIYSQKRICFYSFAFILDLLCYNIYLKVLIFFQSVSFQVIFMTNDMGSTKGLFILGPVTEYLHHQCLSDVCVDLFPFVFILF